MFKHKLKAALTHLAISALVVGCLLVFVLTVWYPTPFFEISGLHHIVLLLVTIDLVLGPLLTLVVFKPLKRTLKFDLAMIAALQIAALAYGMHTVYAAHPLYIAYAGDRFTVINTNEVLPTDAKYPELKKSTLSGPTLVYVQKPADPEEMSRVTMEVLSGKPDLDARAEYYVPFDKSVQDVLAKGQSPDALFSSTQDKSKLDKFLSTHGKTSADYAFLVLVGKEKDVIWAFSRETGQPVDIIEVNPWKQG